MTRSLKGGLFHIADSIIWHFRMQTSTLNFQISGLGIRNSNLSGRVGHYINKCLVSCIRVTLISVDRLNSIHVTDQLVIIAFDHSTRACAQAEWQMRSEYDSARYTQHSIPHVLILAMEWIISDLYACAPFMSTSAEDIPPFLTCQIHAPPCRRWWHGILPLLLSSSMTQDLILEDRTSNVAVLKIFLFFSSCIHIISDHSRHSAVGT